MLKFPVDYKFVTALACLTLIGAAGLAARAITFDDVAAKCVSLFSPYPVHRGDDSQLINKWIVMSDRNPKLAQVTETNADTLTVRWINFDTMLTESLEIPRGKNIFLANDKAFATYRIDLEAASVRMKLRDEQYVGRVVNLGAQLGLARILSLTPMKIEIQHVPSRTMTPTDLTIRRPARLDVLADVNFDDVVTNARRLQSLAAVRTGNYVYWSPNAPMAFNGSTITVQYRNPVHFPYRQALLHDLQERGLIHGRVAEVDLAKGTILLTGPTWAITLPIRTEVLTRSGFLLSPVGTLDSLPPQGFTGFRLFRKAFIFDTLKPGMAVLGFASVGGAPFDNPREEIRGLQYYRIEGVGPDYVSVSTDGRHEVIRGARELSHLSLSSTILGETAEALVSRFEFANQFTYRPRPNVSRDDLKRMPFLNDLNLIVRELGQKGFVEARVRHYAQQIRSSADITFWSGGESPTTEYKSILVGLHATKLADLSPSTRDFAAEVYSRATIAGRKLRGYSERR